MKTLKFEIDRQLFVHVSKVAAMRGITFDEAVSELISEALEEWAAGQNQPKPAENITLH